MQPFSLDIPKIGYFIVYKKQKSKNPLYNWFQNQIVKEQLSEGYSKEDAEYTHVEVSGGGQWTVGAFLFGSKLIDIRKTQKGRDIKIVAYNHSWNDKKRYKIGWFGATKCNLPYGFWSLLWFKLNHIKGFKKRNFLATKKAPFCSFLCAWALKQVFSDALDKPENKMPAYFLDKEKFTVVWEGTL